jgi:hypothetical protein
MVFAVGDFFTSTTSNEALIIVRIVPDKEIRDTLYKVHRLHDGMIKTKFHYELADSLYWTRAT